MPAGLRSYAPGRWGYVRAVIRNDGDDEGTQSARVSLKDNLSLRFARDIWVPAHSRRTTWIPLHIPSDAGPTGQMSIEGASGDREFSIPARLLADEFPTALLSSASGLPAPIELPAEILTESEDAAYEVVLAIRAAQGLSTQVLVPTERMLPPTAQSWDAVSHVVIAGDHLADDSAAQAALRQWLASGGRIWLQLDSTSPDTARRLLGEAFRVEVVDRVALSELPDSFVPGEVNVPLLELEQQVELVRVLVDDAEVISAVHGWPACFAIPFGRGEVIVTTLSPRGWMRLRNSSDPPVDPLKTTKYVATDPLRTLQMRFMAPRADQLPSAELQREYLAQKIGYQVPSRASVLGLLAAFCSLILLSGVVLSRQRRLEYLAWMTFASGVIAAGAIVGLGLASQQAVPPTAAEVQFVEVVPKADTLAARGSFAVYQTDLNALELESTAGTWLDPQLPDLAGQIRQLTWTDLDRWHFERMELPPGVRMFSSQTALSLDDPPRAVARFGASGLEGRLTTSIFSSVADALVAPPFGNPLAAHLADEGKFLVGPTDLLAEGQFISDQLLSDEQLRRQNLYAAYFAGRPPGSPLHLLAWTDPVADSMRWSAETRQIGGLLLSVPLVIERTPADTEVVIPASLLDVHTVEGTSGRSTSFDNRTRMWQFPLRSATVTRLRWQLPPSVLPMRLDRALLTIDCNIPSRQLGIYAIQAGERISIAQQPSPSGRIEIDITGSELPDVDSRGGIALEFEVGELSTAGDEAAVTGTWSIRSSALDVWGRTLPADEPTAEKNP